MALIKCPECGKMISDKADRCISCGYDALHKNKKKGIIILLLIFLLLIGIIAFVLLINKKDNGDMIKDNTSNNEISDGVTMEEGFAEDEIISKSFGKDEKIVSESCEFTLTGYNISKKIEPKNISGLYFYTYFEASSGNQYVDVKFSIKNKGTTGVKQDEILGQVKLIYDGSYEYNCSFVTVDHEGDFENYTNLYDIAPLETLEYHMLAEVPDEVKSSSKSLICQVTVDGKIYECKLR